MNKRVKKKLKSRHNYHTFIDFRIFNEAAKVIPANYLPLVDCYFMITLTKSHRHLKSVTVLFDFNSTNRRFGVTPLETSAIPDVKLSTLYNCSSVTFYR